MFGNKTAEVLIVGAGPVGMTTALLLAEQGVNATLIDSAGATAARSYACALHSRSLELLDRLGIIGEVLEWAYCLKKLAFYDGHTRRAEVNLSITSAKYPFIAVLPQNALEWLLERTLNQRGRVRVNWHHRLSSLEPLVSGMVASVDELRAGLPLRHAPTPAELVERTMNIHAPFVVGADGQNSTVRQSLGNESERMGESDSFSVFEFETDVELEKEVRVVLDETTTNVLWPISSRRCRWSFQMLRPETEPGFPEKDRQPSESKHPESERDSQQQLQRLLEARAPWFAAKVVKLDWVQRVRFDRCLTKRFCRGRCWLVGDAAHQTGPVGMQSLNVGMWEADELSAILTNVLLGKATAADSETTWNHRWREEWLRLLGRDRNWSAAGNASDWISRRAARIPECLPAAGEQLGQLLGQLERCPDKG